MNMNLQKKDSFELSESAMNFNSQLYDQSTCSSNSNIVTEEYLLQKQQQQKQLKQIISFINQTNGESQNYSQNVDENMSILQKMAFLKKQQQQNNNNNLKKYEQQQKEQQEQNLSQNWYIQQQQNDSNQFIDRIAQLEKYNTDEKANDIKEKQQLLKNTNQIQSLSIQIQNNNINCESSIKNTQQQQNQNKNNNNKIINYKEAEKKFFCEIQQNSKKIGKKLTLKQIMLENTNEKILKCQKDVVCTYQTTSRRLLLQHQRRQHLKSNRVVCGTQIFQCQYCSQSFTLQQALQYHVENQHSDQ